MAKSQIIAEFWGVALIRGGAYARFIQVRASMVQRLLEGAVHVAHDAY